MAGLSLLPKETKFFALFQQQGENIVKMAQQLKDMLFVWQNIKERAFIIADMEQDGDAIIHNIMTYLHRTFLTPIDREDISAIAHSLDDIADRIRAITDTLYLYRIEVPTSRAKELSEMILKATQEVAGGIAEIKNRTNQTEVMKRSVTINQIENSGDIVYRSALAELFDNPVDMVFVIKWREVYKKMEAALNGCETFANVLEGIGTKYS